MVPYCPRNHPQRRYYGRSHGFTVIELMVTVAVMAILATLAAPSFTDMMRRERMKGAAENFFGSLQFAKSESIKRNASVTLRLTYNTSSWSYCVDTTTDCSSGAVLKSESSASYPNITVSSAGSAASPVIITFSSLRGTIAAATNVQFTDGTRSLDVRVSLLGGIRVCTTGTITWYEGC